MGVEDSDYIKELIADEHPDNIAELGGISQELFRTLGAVWGDMDLSHRPAGGSDELHNLVKDTLDRAQGLCPRCRGAMRIKPDDPEAVGEGDGLVRCPTCEGSGFAPEAWEAVYARSQKTFCALKITRPMVAEAFDVPQARFAGERDATMRRIAQEIHEELLINSRDKVNRLLSWATRRGLGPDQLAMRLDPSGKLRIQQFLELLKVSGWRKVEGSIYCKEHPPEIAFLPRGDLPLVTEKDLERFRCKEGLLLNCEHPHCGTKIFQPTGPDTALEITPKAG